MNPFLCAMILASGVPGVGTANLLPVAEESTCSDMQTLIARQRLRAGQVAFVRTIPNRSVAGDRSVVVHIRVDADAKPIPLDPKEPYADNLLQDAAN